MNNNWLLYCCFSVHIRQISLTVFEWEAVRYTFNSYCPVSMDNTIRVQQILRYETHVFRDGFYKGIMFILYAIVQNH